MSKTLTICFIFLSGHFFFSMPTNVEARFPVADFEKRNLPQTCYYSGITKEEMELFLKDGNPMMLKRLADNSEFKKQQIRNLRELLAIACQAVKEGFVEDLKVKRELKDIEIEVTAVNFDREINKDKTRIHFGYVSEISIKEFYENQGNLADFESFFKFK